MLVSCIIPTYKRKEVLNRAISSVMNQSYEDIEILVISDNNEGDEFDLYIKKIIDEVSKSYKIKIYNTPLAQSGGACARNIGIKNAKGTYIAFLDDDDIWLPTKIEKQISKMNFDKNYACTCEKQLYIGDKKLKTPRIAKKFEDIDQMLEVLTRRSTLYTPTLLFRKEVFEKGLLFDEKLKRHQDLQLLTNFLDQNYKFSVVNEVLVNIFVDDKSNKPDLKALKEIKKDFFSSISQTLKIFNNRDIRRIKFAHQLEIVFIALRQKNMKIVLSEIKKLPISLSGMIDFFVRVRRRK